MGSRSRGPDFRYGNLGSKRLEQFLRERQEHADRILADRGAVKPVSTFRRALPQVLASTAKNLILLDLGMTIGFSTIVIPVLLKAKHGLYFTPVLASWFGSVGFLCQPLGSVLSGMILEPLGRKYAMMVVNVPQLVGWYLLYIAESLYTVFTAAILLGFGVGFSEAPIITYVGEVSEPQFRGRLISYSQLCYSLGYVVTYGLGNLTDWQNVAGISCFFPIVTVIALTQVPESPLWLASKGRYGDAEAALCWLRGWVEPRAVLTELTEIMHYTQYKSGYRPESVSYSNNVDIDDENISKNTIQSNLDSVQVFGEVQGTKQYDQDEKKSLDNFEKKEENISLSIKDIMRPEILKPFGFVSGFFFFLHTSGISPMRPYFMTIFEELNFPIASNRSNVIFSVTQFLGIALCLITVPWFGKKPIALVSMLACALSATLTGLYVVFGDPSHGSGWLPFTTMTTLQFFTGYGVSAIPWMLLSEVFPNRGRALATGVAAAVFYVTGFVAIKTYLSLEASLGLGGVLLLFGGLSFVGFVFIYLTMIETEGLSLEQIELQYKSCNRSRT